MFSVVHIAFLKCLIQHYIALQALCLEELNHLVACSTADPTNTTFLHLLLIGSGTLKGYARLCRAL